MNRALATRRAARSISLLVVVGLVAAGTAYAQQTIGTCPVLPANNIWNTPVDTLPVLSNSASMVTTIGANTGFHADFGAGIVGRRTDRHSVHHRSRDADEISGDVLSTRTRATPDRTRFR